MIREVHLGILVELVEALAAFERSWEPPHSCFDHVRLGNTNRAIQQLEAGRQNVGGENTDHEKRIVLKFVPKRCLQFLRLLVG